MKRAMAMQQLEELRTLLVRAQRAENACVRKLNAHLIANGSDRITYERLVAQCRSARERSLAAYEEWTKAVARCGEPTQQAPAVDGQSVEA
jgi:hypothetical protein